MKKREKKQERRSGREKKLGGCVCEREREREGERERGKEESNFSQLPYLS